MGRVIKIEETNSKHEKTPRSLTCKYYDYTEHIKSVNSHLAFSTKITSIRNNDTITYSYKNSTPDYIKSKLNKKGELNGMPKMKATLMVDSDLNEHIHFYTRSLEHEKDKVNSYYMYDSLGYFRVKKTYKNEITIKHIELDYDENFIQSETNFVLDNSIIFTYNELEKLVSKKGEFATTTYEYDDEGSVMRIIKNPKYGNLSMVLRIIRYK